MKRKEITIKGVTYIEKPKVNYVLETFFQLAIGFTIAFILFLMIIAFGKYNITIAGFLG